MADLLTHILIAYALATVLSWRVRWLTPPLVTVALTEAILPDLSRLDLLLPAHSVETVVGIPFSWSPLHRIGGTVVIIGLGTLAVSQQWQRRVALLLLLGASTHYALDFLLYKPAGVTGDLFWPLIGHGIAVDGFYMSSDRWPAAVMIAVAGIVWVTDRVWLSPSPDERAGVEHPDG